MIPIPEIQFDPLYLAEPVKVAAISADSQTPPPRIVFARHLGRALFADAQCMIPITDEDIEEARTAGRAIIRITLADDSAEQLNRFALTLSAMRGQG